MGFTSLSLLLLLVVLLKLSYNGKNRLLLLPHNNDNLLFFSFSANASPWSIFHSKEVENRIGKSDGDLKVASFSNVNSGSTNTRVCQSEACREAGKALYDSINFTVDPVSKQNNFYKKNVTNLFYSAMTSLSFHVATGMPNIPFLMTRVALELSICSMTH